MSILNPTVNRLVRIKIPRGLSLVVIYLIMFAALSLTIAAIIPTLIAQTTIFVSGFPAYIDNIGVFGNYTERIISQSIESVSTLPSSIGRLIISAFSNALTVFTIFIFSYYLIMERPKLKQKLLEFMGDEKGGEVYKIVSSVETKLGGWARGQFLLMFLIWISSYIGLLALGVPFALPLSFLAGLFELIPNFGPVLSAIPAVIIGFGISPFTGIAVLALYFLIQQVENYIFVPKVMEKSVGINPLIILLAITIGFRLGGIPGIIVSVPIIINLQVMWQEYKSITSK